LFELDVVTINFLLEHVRLLKFGTPTLDISVVFFNEVIVLPIVLLILGFIRHILSSTLNGDAFSVIFIARRVIAVHSLFFFKGSATSVGTTDWRRRWGRGILNYGSLCTCCEAYATFLSSSTCFSSLVLQFKEPRASVVWFPMLESC
jgi:hypothetical protein